MTILFPGCFTRTIPRHPRGTDMFGGESMDFYLWIAVGLLGFGALTRYLLLLPPAATDPGRPTVADIRRRLQSERVPGHDSTMPSPRNISSRSFSASDFSLANVLQPRTTPSGPDFVVHEPTA
ncbi:hypothetical protein FNL39_11285 [Nocardia caishijiensis]|uniref:Uncharacterized protein n=1 Tax=Nocardia caishijiensis TaxID=184756 RepID=A0ABQ6YFK2_9NOCA|nr:hypothetical protein FNL39_11285 [Nocardia caishijiensis]